MKKRALLLSVWVLLIAVVLGACQDDRQSDSSSTNTSSTNTPADSEPLQGGRLVYGMTQDLVSLDPHQSTDAGTRSVVFNLYEGLVKPTPAGELGRPSRSRSIFRTMLKRIRLR